jgi:hypothetical protein
MKRAPVIFATVIFSLVCVFLIERPYRPPSSLDQPRIIFIAVLKPLCITAVSLE